ncbi:sterol desaturase family protein [Methylocystis parvus]|uniref:Fatty acid hydroxylase n=1 Tax=Methylocystis parvus TaxID=134 RepID=A0A6B8M2P6_9HYPH|nr:sterol desaturase family protein [Methylocystis parvus]QGM96512.1 fatty acid hydroxylase [Methylocystis parvus]WBJ99638.1 sterol desaturase family protein [Methylocystis parvus OBBP]
MSQERTEALDASPRLFENDLLDKLSRVHHLTPVVVYTPIILGLAFYSLSEVGLGLLLLGLVIGYVGWTLTEYFGHRYLFHTVFPLPFGLGPRFQFLIHGVHHIYPNDPLRLVMPPLLSAPIMLIALTIIRLIFGATFGWAVLAGFMAGYVIYDGVHYWTHHGQPTSDLGKMVKRLHMLHHFRDAEKGFGVHAIWWDYVFGTAYQKGDTPGSKAV